MYIRFITSFMNSYGERESGIFQALGFLRRHDDTRHEDVEKLLELRDWFDIHLESPSKFTKRQKQSETGTALGWYRNTAKEHIAKMYELSQVLEKYGIIVSVVRRKDPGYIVYEDDIQVTALVYREDRKEVI